MPLISLFFGIKIYIYYDDHDPPHFHADYQGKKAVFDFRGNIINGNLGSRTATKLVREWVDLHAEELGGQEHAGLAIPRRRAVMDWI